MSGANGYMQALTLGRDALRELDVNSVARYSGARVHQECGRETALLMDFLNDEVTLSWPEMIFSTGKSGVEPPVQEQILLLHYLRGAWASCGAAATGEWIAFQEVLDGRFYVDAFNRRAKHPLVRTFGKKPETLVEIAVALFGAVPLDQGDFSVMVPVLPLIRIALVLWRGDEEFAPEGNLLFDRNISGILCAEYIAWLAGMLVYPLIDRAKRA